MKIVSWIKSHPWMSLSIVSLIVLVGSVYGQLFQSYFATDEWWGFSFAVARPTFREIIQPTGLVSPGSNLLIAGLYRAFGINLPVWAGLALALHLTTTGLIYWLAARLSRSLLVGFASAALFAILPMGSEFVHQLSLLPGAVGVALAFSSLVAYSYRKPWVAAGLFLLSLSFTPYTAPFAGLVFLVELTLVERKTAWRSLLRLGPVAAVVAGYIWMVQAIAVKSGQLSDRPISGDTALAERLQMIGTKIYQTYGELILYRPGQIDRALVLQASHWLVGIALVIIVYLFWRRQVALARSALIGLLWIPVAISIFATLNTVHLESSYSGRYFYVSMAGLALLVSSLAVGVVNDLTVRKPKLAPLAVIGLVIVGILYYAPRTAKAVANEVGVGKTRRHIMETILADVPKPLPHDALFCFTSNAVHYGQSGDKIPLPFVHNFLFNIALFYRADDPQFRVFFTEGGYFLNPAANYYYYRDDPTAPSRIGPGLGFATNLENCQFLKTTYGILSLDEVYGFAYDGNRQRLTSISQPLRRYLAGDQSARAELYPWESTK